MENNEAPIVDFFGVAEPVLVELGDTKIDVREFVAEEFHLAQALMEYVLGSKEERVTQFESAVKALSKAVNVPEAKLRKMRAANFTLLAGKVFDVNQDFFLQNTQMRLRVAQLMQGLIS